MTAGVPAEAASAGELHTPRRNNSMWAMPHAMAAVTATVLLCVSLAAVWVYANQLAKEYIHAVAPRNIYQKTDGVTLQREAFRHNDLLPLYGSSELIYAIPNRATDFFRHYPTGFAIFPIGEQGTPLLIKVQSLAAVGEELRGKRVAVFVSPPPFLTPQVQPTQPHAAYADKFSRLHAGELVFSTSLSFALKQRIARRMLDQASMLEQHPVLRLALHQLADGSPSARVRYYALFPVGKLQNLILRLQDGGRVVVLLALRPPVDSAIRRPAGVDWEALAAAAEREYRTQTQSNSLGVSDKWWTRFGPYTMRQQGTLSDSVFLGRVATASIWQDLELLLQTLQELDAEVLILVIPFHARFLELCGVSPQARGKYYARIREMAMRYGARVADFAAHESDPYFHQDVISHPSPKGWIYYDEALDDFYHLPPR